VDLALTRPVDRRSGIRELAEQGRSSLTLALRTGMTADVINVSPGGALVETSARLAPGTKLSLRPFSTRTGIVFQAAVIHCQVWSLGLASGLRFRAGLCFDPGSDYPPGQPLPGREKVLPTRPGRRQGLWADRARITRRHRGGPQVV
jgi:hypothetical protein